MSYAIADRANFENIQDLFFDEVDAVFGGLSLAEKLSATAGGLALASATLGGITNPVGAAVLAAAATAEVGAIAASAFGD